MKLVAHIVVNQVIIMEFLDVSPGNLFTVTYFTREWNTVLMFKLEWCVSHTYWHVEYLPTSM